MTKRERADVDRYHESLERAYWEFDAFRKRPGRPMSERDAFKAAVRGVLPRPPGDVAAIPTEED